MRSGVLAAVAAFVLTAVASAPPALGQTATTTRLAGLFKIVPGAAWRDSDGSRNLTFGCAPLRRDRFGAQGSVVTLHLRFVALPRSYPPWVVWSSETSLPEGVGREPCDLRKGIDTVTFPIPEGLSVQDPYIPVVGYDDQDGLFLVGGTHGMPMYRLRDYSGAPRGTFTPPPPGVLN